MQLQRACLLDLTWFLVRGSSCNSFVVTFGPLHQDQNANSQKGRRPESSLLMLTDDVILYVAETLIRSRCSACWRWPRCTGPAPAGRCYALVRQPAIRDRSCDVVPGTSLTFRSSRQCLRTPRSVARVFDGPRPRSGSSSIRMATRSGTFRCTSRSPCARLSSWRRRVKFRSGSRTPKTCATTQHGGADGYLLEDEPRLGLQMPLIASKTCPPCFSTTRSASRPMSRWSRRVSTSALCPRCGRIARRRTTCCEASCPACFAT